MDFSLALKLAFPIKTQLVVMVRSESAGSQLTIGSLVRRAGLVITLSLYWMFDDFVVYCASKMW
jgi:hypothetical protein